LVSNYLGAMQVEDHHKNAFNDVVLSGYSCDAGNEFHFYCLQPVCVSEELKKADDLNHSLRSQVHESRQLTVNM